MKTSACSAALALSLLASGSGTSAHNGADVSCPARIAASPKPDGEGTIERLLSEAEAMTLLSSTQVIVGRPIDGAYINNIRAVVRKQDGTVRTVLLPYDMEAGVGDRIAFQTGYLSSPPLCTYVPALATSQLTRD